MSDRYEYGLGVKNWPAKLIKIDPEVLKILESFRGKKSWSKFMEELAHKLKTRNI